MIRSLARAAALLVAGPFVVYVSALAPQHLHEPGPGHDHAVAHSHFAPHEVEARHANETEIEHDIAHVVWLDSSVDATQTYQASPVPLALGLVTTAVTTERRWSVTPSDNHAPAHGPPRTAHRFRGPPPSCLS